MKIDRRITNGLAWAGAVLVVAIPVADFAMRQASPEPTQLAVVSEEAEETSVSSPTPAAERPQVAQAETPAVAQASPADATEVKAETTPRPSTASGDPVDSFIESGRELPSYISGGSNSAPAQQAKPVTTVTTPKPAAPAPVAPQPAAPVASTPAPVAAATPPQREVTMPTPVSQRPPSVPQSQVRPAPVPQQPPLIVEEQVPVFTAEDLEDWESGPLSEFLANRGQGRQAPAPEYDNNGFFLDEGPNNGRQESFPRAYGEGFYYPFSQ